jgi:hypothetical protein
MVCRTQLVRVTFTPRLEEYQLPTRPPVSNSSQFYTGLAPGCWFFFKIPLFVSHFRNFILIINPFFIEVNWRRRIKNTRVQGGTNLQSGRLGNTPCHMHSVCSVHAVRYVTIDDMTDIFATLHACFIPRHRRRRCRSVGTTCAHAKLAAIIFFPMRPHPEE